MSKFFFQPHLGRRMMTRSLLGKVAVCATAINFIWYGASPAYGLWSIESPTMSEEIGRSVDVAGTGVGTALAGYVFKVTNADGDSVYQQASGTVGADQGGGEGYWDKTLSPPSEAPYNGLWHEGAAQAKVFNQGQEQASQHIEFVNQP
jgi:hypothetical protein